MKRKLVILFCLVAMLLTVIIVVNKKVTGDKEVLGEKVASIKLQVTSDKTTEEDIKTESEKLQVTNEKAEEKKNNIKYYRPTAACPIVQSGAAQQAGAAIFNINNDGDKLDLSAARVQNEQNIKQYYSVTKVVDGDTIDVLTGTTTERVRLIGINTPETVDPRKPVECFGKEASTKAREFLENKKVYLEADKTRDNRDKYGRLLRYAWREDGLFYNLEIIKQGYAYEYTYQIPYKYQAEFKAAQNYARENKLGLWADDVCSVTADVATTSAVGNAAPNPDCVIKGNINSKGEKIYHLLNCGSYAKTVINIEQGERWFCNEAEAQAAGWRRAQNCE